MTAPGAQGRDPRGGTRHPFPAGDEEPAQGDAARRRQAVDPVRRRGGGAGRSHRHPHHHRSGQAGDRGPLRPQLRARVLPGAEGHGTSCSRRSRRPPSSATSTTSASAIRSGSGTRSRWPVSTSATSRSRCCSATTSWSTSRRLLRSMLDVHERYGRSVLALKEVTAGRDLVVRVCRARRGRGRARRGCSSIVEKPKRRRTRRRTSR